MEEDKFYNNIQKVLEEIPENYSILEERIDIEIQMKYFEFTKELRAKNRAEEYFQEREKLFQDEVSVEEKKEILTAIAVYDDVKAYRTLEKYVDEADGELKQWAVLALQESRMLMQSSLLDEQQVFISTGLGGKGKKLRYYVVFLSQSMDEMLSNTQQKLLKDELIFELKKHEGEFESMDFMEGFSCSLVMVPLSVDIKVVFQNIIDECNQYGNFLQEDLVITNVKIMSRSEIIQLIHKKKNQNSDELESE